MSVFLLTWNPKLWKISDEDWHSQVQKIASGGTYEEPWSIGSRRSGVHPGDTFLLVRVAKDRGIVASGVAVSVAFKDLHWDAKRAKKKDFANYVIVEWDAQVEIANRLATEDLLTEFPEVPWNNLAGSGVRVDEEIAEKLTTRWFNHIGIQPETYPDETPTFIEGGSKPVLVNRYERNPAARRECLQIHGKTCAVCGFDGSSTYGRNGEGLIHVHHLLEIAGVGKEYEVDPSKDLIPVCPNCHAMIHRRRPAYSIAEVKKMLKVKKPN
jgi:5-methylcytosine-specific restriction protein A